MPSGTFAPMFLHETKGARIVLTQEPDAKNAAMIANSIPSGPNLRVQMLGEFLDDQIATVRRIIAALPKCGCDDELKPEPETVAAIHAAMTKH